MPLTEVFQYQFSVFSFSIMTRNLYLREMVFKRAVDFVTQARVDYLCQIQGLSTRKVAEMCNISRGSVCRITKERFSMTEKSKEHLKRGPAFKLTAKQGRQILRAVVCLRQREANFSSKRIMQEAGVSETEVSVRTVQRFLNSQGYHYLKARQKGLLTANDMRKKLQFARKMKRDYRPDVWTKQIGFYLDGVSFVYKRNPLDRARAPKAQIWRRKDEGLTTGCLAKGGKEGTGGNYVKVIVAISHDKGVIACHPFQKMTRRFFASFIEEHFSRMFELAGKGGENLFIHDNCPCQNSALLPSYCQKGGPNKALKVF